MDCVGDVNNCYKHEELVLLKNGGLLGFNQKGCLKILPLNVYVNKYYLETILSLKYVNTFQECV